MSDLTGDWAGQSACREYDPDLWFPPPAPYQTEAGEAARWAFPRTVCVEDCPVQAECLEYAMRMERSHVTRMRAGMWGGLTPVERSALYRQQIEARRAG